MKTKQKLALSFFEKRILPGLLDEHDRDEAKVNKAIADEFTLVDDGGRRIEYSVSCKKSAESDIDYKSEVSRLVGEELGKLSFKGNPLGHHNMNTKSIHGRSKVFSGDDGAIKAARWGHFALACLGRENSKAWLDNQGIHLKAQVEGVNTTGGYIVPDQLDADIIDLKLEYGVIRANAHPLTMTSDTATRPRRTGGLTASFVGEGVAGTQSTKTWDNVGLTAKKLMVLAVISSELNEDAIVNVGDDLAGEIAYAFTLKEDQCAFIGDGTTTYGGMTGIITRLSTLNGVDDGGGLVLASGNLYSEIVLSDLTNLMVRCPAYARRNAKWFASQTFIDAVLTRLIVAAGGMTASEVANGVASMRFLGYPVVPTEVMPSTTANSQICALFGDLRQSTTFGDRRQSTISMFNSGTVDGVDLVSTDQIGIRGTERFDVVTHDVGTASVAGPVVGLITASA